MFKLFFAPVLVFLFAATLPAQTFTGGGGQIPDDGNSITYDISVTNLPATLDTTNFGLMSVCINLTHTWDADLAASLRAPDGTTIPLFSSIGGDADGFINTCF